MSEPRDEQVLDSQSPDLTEEEPHARQMGRMFNPQSICRFPIMLDLSAGTRDFWLYIRIAVCCGDKGRMG